MELIKQIVTLIASFIFSYLVAKYPDFPLEKGNFINLIIWIFTIFGVINGARLGIFRTKIELQGYKFKNYFKN